MIKPFILFSQLNPSLCIGFTICDKNVMLLKVIILIITQMVFEVMLTTIVVDAIMRMRAIG